MDITSRLNAANGRLRAAKMNIRIEARGSRLCLRTTLPPKPNSVKREPHQQRIALDISANIQGVSLAEAEAKKVRYLLDSKQFAWEPYLGLQQPECAFVKDWVTKYEQEYFEHKARTPKTETTWQMNYLEPFRKLPQNSTLTVNLLKTTLADTLPDSRSRQKTYRAFQKLAHFADLEVDLRPLAGNYSRQHLTPRDLPDDNIIVEYYSALSDPAWRYAYGILAAFGLRPHELFELDTTDLVNGGYTLRVLDGKTGARKVWGFYPEWIDLFNLRSPLIPPVSGKTHRDLGQRVAQYFRRSKLPFKPYDLRHCWAIRTLSLGLDMTLAAQQMGHSLRVHSDIYHYWISDRHHQEAYQGILNKAST